jgi:hypothetical protein
MWMLTIGFVLFSFYVLVHLEGIPIRFLNGGVLYFVLLFRSTYLLPLFAP